MLHKQVTIHLTLTFTFTKYGGRMSKYNKRLVKDLVENVRTILGRIDPLPLFIRFEDGDLFAVPVRSKFTVDEIIEENVE